MLLNSAISAARSLYYWSTEPLKLRWLRWSGGEDAHDADTLLYTDTPLVSIYIPTFNRCDLLIERALKSVIAQTYKNWECIVAAHGCTDDTVARVRELNEELQATHGIGVGGVQRGMAVKASDFRPQIRVIEVERKRTYPPSPENHWFAGPVVPANAALGQCRGQWIARLDDDDAWTPDHLEKLLWFAQDKGHEFVSSAYETDRKRVAHDGHSIPIGGTQTWLYRSYLASFRYNPDCWRKSRDRVNDTDLAQRFRNAGVRIGHLNEVTARVLPRPGTNSVGLAAYRNDERGTMEKLAFR